MLHRMRFRRARAEAAEQVLGYSGAFIQLHREEARYLDRTVHWVQRVGLDYVKQRVLEDAEGARRSMLACSMRCRVRRTRGRNALEASNATNSKR
jgi:NAD(P)H-nitrite reductase large subunit